MPLYQAVILAIVQALTEFLPVSSTAHLALFPWLFGWKDPGLTFDVAVHAGTLVAVLIYFWRLWVDMLKAVVRPSNPDDPNVRQNRKLLGFLVLGTLPAAFAGWTLKHAAEHQFRQPTVIGVALITVGLLMWAGDRLQAQDRRLGHLTLADPLLVGLAQAFAIIPGVSRSGITMTAGLFRGMSRQTAAQFSFLLAAPVIGGAALKEVVEVYRQGLPPEMHLPMLVGVVVAALVGYPVIAVLIRYLERRTFTIFVIYRIALGVIVLALGWGLRHHAG